MKENYPRKEGLAGRAGTDNGPDFVGVATTKTGERDKLTLPRTARLPINRCNLPADILGGLSYQRHPVPLALDGVAELHKALFRRLDEEADPQTRGLLFQGHMAAAFNLDHPEESGYSATSARARAKASYLRMLRGWAFDSDGLEGAVLKGWVESRFGLLTRYHGGPIRDFSGETYRHFLEMRSAGLYGTNALEAQLDLLYTWCQYEMARQHPGETHFTLYRGVNRAGEHEVLREGKDGQRSVLLNNLSSFTTVRERADEFGDTIMQVRVPLPKVFFYRLRLPGLLKGEDECMVIGGVYEVGYTTI